MVSGVLDVARKTPKRNEAAKPELKTTPVKIDSRLIGRAKKIALDQGLTLSAYVSEALRVAIEKDWGKILRKLVEEEERP
jgi:hypothetical protein